MVGIYFFRRKPLHSLSLAAPCDHPTTTQATSTRHTSVVDGLHHGFHLAGEAVVTVMVDVFLCGHVECKVCPRFGHPVYGLNGSVFIGPWHRKVNIHIVVHPVMREWPYQVWLTLTLFNRFFLVYCVFTCLYGHIVMLHISHRFNPFVWMFRVNDENQAWPWVVVFITPPFQQSFQF